MAVGPSPTTSGQRPTWAGNAAALGRPTLSPDGSRLANRQRSTTNAPSVGRQPP
eukprot:CAMPEP_0174304258 /NCGR_PEP_ID=MMETSP0809-20121228/60671_1 /TAXON_ID=73025 ORGANISM="Eutreptiella gymnastica-like, Strain CCMP1594" /NCGR_SAMPLE_ID=MMETSP0809 /ASSEMBLY_ACC=CAM_ASM_000658 /LENGTH=53 /DNA_ID=CAMNT_0015410433 /DNA_START=881 /DNA_END=1038 /DNA_ORIENTATION=+